MTKNTRDQFSGPSQRHQRTIRRPYCSLGAGNLTSFLWKSGDADSGWRYRFKLFRMAAQDGRVSQLFRPADLMHFVKLAQVMAAVIADDGCLSPERGDLRRLATELDELLTRSAEPTNAHPASSNPEELH